MIAVLSSSLQFLHLAVLNAVTQGVFGETVNDSIFNASLDQCVDVPDTKDAFKDRFQQERRGLTVAVLTQDILLSLEQHELNLDKIKQGHLSIRDVVVFVSHLFYQKKCHCLKNCHCCH